MPATFIIEGELSEEGLLDAKTAIESLLGDAGTAVVEDEIPDADELALRKARLLRQWCGDATWHFMSVTAHSYLPGQEFTFDELSATFNEDKATVKSWHRSASKIMNKVDAELGKLPAFLESKWDGERNHYRIPDIMREAIIKASV
jgi:hypothetical protein